MQRALEPGREPEFAEQADDRPGGDLVGERGDQAAVHDVWRTLIALGGHETGHHLVAVPSESKSKAGGMGGPATEAGLVPTKEMTVELLAVFHGRQLEPVASGRQFGIGVCCPSTVEYASAGEKRRRRRLPVAGLGGLDTAGWRMQRRLAGAQLLDDLRSLRTVRRQRPRHRPVRQDVRAKGRRRPVVRAEGRGV